MKTRAFALLLLAFTTGPLWGQTVVEHFDTGTNLLLDNKGVTGVGSLTVQNGRLEFTTTGTPTANDGQQAFYSPGANGAGFSVGDPKSVLVGSVSSDWSARVTVHVADFGELNAGMSPPRAASTAQGFYAGLFVYQLQNTLYDHGAMTYPSYSSVYDTERQAVAGTWGNNLWTQQPASGALDFVVQVSYSASTHLLTQQVSIDDGAHWITDLSFDVTQPAGNHTGGWDMTTGFNGPSFGVSFTAGSNNLVVSSGDIYFDDFTSSGLTIGDYPAYQSAVPEPSTYATLAGLAGLFAALRHRRLTRAGNLETN